MKFYLVNDVEIEDTLLSVKTVSDSREKKQPDFVVSMADWTVGEQASNPEIVGDTGDGTVTFEYSESLDGDFTSEVPAKVGKYYLKATTPETNEYFGAVTTATFRILKKNEEVVIKQQLTLLVEMADWTEGELPSEPVLTGNNGNGKAVYEYSSDFEGVYSQVVPQNVGRYYLCATVEETENYYGGITTCTFNINEKKIETPAPTESAMVSSVPSSTPSNEPTIKPIESGEPVVTPSDAPHESNMPSATPEESFIPSANPEESFTPSLYTSRKQCA